MITEPELEALRDWLWQLALHRISNVKVVIGPGSELLVTALRGLAMKAVAPQTGPACPHCGSGGDAPCCRLGCDGLQCVHCIAHLAAERTPEQELELSKKLLQAALGEPGGIRDTGCVNYDLVARIESFLAPKAQPQVPECIDISEDPKMPARCTNITEQANAHGGSIRWLCQIEHEDGRFAGVYVEDHEAAVALRTHEASLPMVYYVLRRARQQVRDPGAKIGLSLIGAELTDLGQVDISQCPAGWEPTGDGGLCYGNRGGEATSFVFVRNGNVEIVQGDEGASAPAAVVRYALGMPADPTGVDARALYWQKQFSLTCEANTALSREVIRLTEALIEANSKNADKDR